MLKVVEAFSGLGSQAQALKNIGVEHEVINTIDWDINAIYAYDILHNGKQDLKSLEHLSKDDLVYILKDYNLSSNGKEPLEYKSLKLMRESTLRHVYAAILRSNNLVNVQEVRPKDFRAEIDILTYSFPCQDLSVSGFWHGNEGGIDRDANNRSSMLWEIERLLFEMSNEERSLPKFLVMENVTAIRSKRHSRNFIEWQNVLEGLGYVNQVYDLSATDFGIPQIRVRTFMISIFVGENLNKRELVNDYLSKNNLEENPNLYIKHEKGKVKNYLRLDYSNLEYKKEAILCTPNNTDSRKKIHEKNPIIFNVKDGVYRDVVRTITTKQDRHPNSGVVEHSFNNSEKAAFRYLTPRECFLFMGFDEADYQRLVNNNFESRKNSDFLSRDKLTKLAGNSIVVKILESIFLQIIEIKKIID